MSEQRRPAGQTGARRQQQSAAYQRRGQPPRRRKRRRRVTGRFIVFLALIAVIAVGSGILVSVLMNRSGDGKPVAASATPAPDGGNALTAADDNGASNVVNLGDAGAEDISQLLGNQDAVIAGLSQEQMIQVEDLNMASGLDAKWMNILLLGSDARHTDESSRTDTMIICSVNTSSGDVKLTSILRDVAVTFDDIGQYNGTYRLNAANYFGGPKLAMKTINECFGMNIQYYVMVDFTSFSVIA